MNHSEEAVDKILAVLRNAEAPPEMELRILRTLERQDAIRPQHKRSIWLHLLGTKPLAFGAAFASLFAILLLSDLFRQKQSHPVRPEGSTASLQPQEAVSIVKAQKLAVVQIQTPKKREKEKSSQTNSLLLQEMHAPSQPAPPLPLTEQEKLLLRVAHRGDPQQLALLNTQLRLQEEKEERADFQNFFEPPTPGESQ